MLWYGIRKRRKGCGDRHREQSRRKKDDHEPQRPRLDAHPQDQGHCHDQHDLNRLLGDLKYETAYDYRAACDGHAHQAIEIARLLVPQQGHGATDPVADDRERNDAREHEADVVVGPYDPGIDGAFDPGPKEHQPDGRLGDAENEIEPFAQKLDPPPPDQGHDLLHPARARLRARDNMNRRYSLTQGRFFYGHDAFSVSRSSRPV